MRHLIILGVRSPLCVEVEETCLRCGITVEAAISFGGESRWLNQSAVVPHDEFEFEQAHGTGFFPCAFSPERRRAIAAEGHQRGLKRATPLVDPTAVIARSARLSSLSYVNATAVIGAATLVRTGALVNRATSIGHHCIIGAFVSIGPGATLASNVIVDDDTIIGSGAIICPDVRIGAGAVIGAGATVKRDVPNGALVVPAESLILEGAAKRTRLRRGTDE